MNLPPACRRVRINSTPLIFSLGWMSTGMPRPSSSTWQEPSLNKVTSMCVAMAGERLIDAVVDDFVRQMIRARGVGVHARAPAHRVQAAQHLDVGGGIRRCHRLPLWKAAESSTRICRRISWRPTTRFRYLFGDMGIANAQNMARSIPVLPQPYGIRVRLRPRGSVCEAPRHRLAEDPLVLHRSGTRPRARGDVPQARIFAHRRSAGAGLRKSRETRRKPQPLAACLSASGTPGRGRFDPVESGRSA